MERKRGRVRARGVAGLRRAPARAPAELLHPFNRTPLLPRYKKADNAFYIFADDVAPRHMTAAMT